MGAPDLRAMIQVGLDILNTTINEKTGKLLMQLGSVQGQTVDTDGAEPWNQYGVVSRPPKPVAGKLAAQAIVFRTGDRDIVLATQDQRGLELYGNLGYGEVAVYSAGEDGEGQARTLWKKDGSVCTMTTNDNTPDGKVVALTVSPTALKFTAPWGSLVFDASGLHIKTKAGPRLDMGGLSIPGLPDALIGPFTGYFKVTAPTVKLDSGSVFIGAGSIFNPATWAPVNATLPPPIPVLPGVTIQSQSVWVSP